MTYLTDFPTCFCLQTKCEPKMAIYPIYKRFLDLG